MRSAFDGQAVKAKIAIFLRSSFSGNKAENLGAGLGFQSRVLMVQSCDYDAAGTDGDQSRTNHLSRYYFVWSLAWSPAWRSTSAMKFGI
jgi:hypothetical protein